MGTLWGTWEFEQINVGFSPFGEENFLKDKNCVWQTDGDKSKSASSLLPADGSVSGGSELSSFSHHFGREPLVRPGRASVAHSG
jgi:hypothetical protein